MALTLVAKMIQNPDGLDRNNILCRKIPFSYIADRKVIKDGQNRLCYEFLL